MKNSEYWKKRAKIAGRKIGDSPAYTIPTWPVRKILDLLSSGITKIPTMVKKPPVSVFIKYDKNNKKINEGEKKYTYDDILDGVLDRISKEKDENNQGKLKFTADSLKSIGVSNEITNLINAQISDLLAKDNKPENNQLGAHFKDESNERVQISGKGDIDYNAITQNERKRVAGQIAFFTRKYLEKKPQDRQFIEEEDLKGVDDEPGPLKKYIEDGMKRDEISYLKVAMVALPVLAVGVMMCVALTNPIVIGIGGLLIAVGALALVATAIYKNKELSIDKLTQTIQQEDQDRFKNLEQEVADEKIRRKEDKAIGKTSTGENPGQNLDSNAAAAQQLLQQQLPQQLSGVGTAQETQQSSHQERLNQQQQNTQTTSLSS